MEPCTSPRLFYVKIRVEHLILFVLLKAASRNLPSKCDVLGIHTQPQGPRAEGSRGFRPEIAPNQFMLTSSEGSGVIASLEPRLSPGDPGSEKPTSDEAVTRCEHFQGFHPVSCSQF
jgi:hypothetical protein